MTTQSSIERCVCLNGAEVVLTEEVRGNMKAYGVTTTTSHSEEWQGPEYELTAAYRLFNTAVSRAMWLHKEPKPAEGEEWR